MDAAISNKKPVAPKARKPRKAHLKSVPDTKQNPDDVPHPDAKLQTRVAVAELRRAVAQLCNVADGKSTMPLLRNVRIRADKEVVVLDATDLDNTLTITLDAEWHNGMGAATVECRRLKEILRVLPDGITTLESKDGSQLRMHVDGCTTNLLGMPDRDFPKCPTTDDVEWHTMDGGILRDLLESVSESICRDETRFHLNGVLLEASDGERIVAVTTDGHRLSKAQRAYKTALFAKGVIVNGAAVRELRRLLVGEMCKVGVKGAHVFVQQGNWTLAAKAIDAQFPPYEQVIPKESRKLLVTCDRQRLIEACKRARALCSETRGLRIQVDNGNLLMTSDSPDVGELHERVPSDYVVRGDVPSVVGVNPAFLQAALERVTGEQCVLGIHDELDPIMVRSIDDATMRTVEDAEFLVVVMPMRV